MKRFTNKTIKGFLFALLMGIFIFNTLNAQEKNFRDQAWRYGLNFGLQFNSLSLGYQNLHAPFPNFSSGTEKIDNSDGKGIGLYGGIFGEYLSDSWWGFQLRVSYDVRDGLVKDTTTGPPSGRTTAVAFETYMNYLSWELLFRADQKLVPNLNMYFGPIIAINIHGTYDYKADMNGPVTETGIKIDNRNIVSYGITGGMAYDIELSRSQNSSMYLSPFADASWIVNQKKTDYPDQNSVTDTWSTLSLRLGLRLSIESRNPPDNRITYVPVYIPTPVENTPPAKVDKKLVFVIMPTDNTILTQKIEGYFPIHPYVFFDKGNTEIPSRYTLLNKEQATTFKESDITEFIKGDLTVKETNVNQLMSSYYNILNIYGDRMRRNPKVQLSLRGCDPEEKGGAACGDKIKTYLVNNFGIDARRIKIEVEPAVKPSGSEYTDPAFSELIDDENRRVQFVFSDPEMLRPLSYTIRDESSINNDMIFSIADNVPFKSWMITISGENQKMSLGPITGNTARINPAQLMRGLQEGDYDAKVVVTMNDGQKVTEDLDFRLYKDTQLSNATRYLMIFDYNKSDAVLVYETKIRDEITPGMLVGNKVIIHGHTDNIGNEAGNLKLSQARADEAKRIVDDQLGKDNRVVNVQAIGIGQANMQYTFDNKNPEGRMYNRNVFVEIIR